MERRVNKKILIAFAAEIAEWRKMAYSEPRKDVACTIHAKCGAAEVLICRVAKKFNPRFNKDKFIEACRKG